MEGLIAALLASSRDTETTKIAVLLAAEHVREQIASKQTPSFALDTVVITNKGTFCEFSMDGAFSKWHIVEKMTHRRITKTKFGKAVDFDEMLPMKDVFAAVVNFHLNRVGTRIRKLIVWNRPHGLKNCTPLSVKELHWHHESKHGNQCTWLDSIHHLELVNLEITGNNNNIFYEPTIRKVKKLTIQTEVPLAVEIILMFQGKELVLLNQIPSPSLLEGIIEKWTDGTMLNGRSIETKVESKNMRGQIMQFVAESLGIGMYIPDDHVDTATLHCANGGVIEFSCTNEKFVMKTSID